MSLPFDAVEGWDAVNGEVREGGFLEVDEGYVGLVETFVVVVLEAVVFRAEEEFLEKVRALDSTNRDRHVEGAIQKNDRQTCLLQRHNDILLLLVPHTRPHLIRPKIVDELVGLADEDTLRVVRDQEHKATARPQAFEVSLALGFCGVFVIFERWIVRHSSAMASHVFVKRAINILCYLLFFDGHWSVCHCDGDVGLSDVLGQVAVFSSELLHSLDAAGTGADCRDSFSFDVDAAFWVGCGVD
jgi:hypothetical protein